MAIELTAYVVVKSILYYQYRLMGLPTLAKKLSLPRALFCFLKEEQSGQLKSRSNPERMAQSNLIIVSRLVPFMIRYAIATVSFAAALPQGEELADQPGNN